MGMRSFIIFSSEDMKNKKEPVESSLKDPLNSTPIDTSLSEPMKMLESINPSLSNSSKLKSQESKDSDLIHRLLFLCSSFYLH